MAYTLWRGVVGLIKPTRRPGSLEELIRMLPEGIGLVPLLLNVREGSHQEFSTAIPYYEKYVAELAEQGMDMIHPGGTPPFMLQGYEGEKRLIKSWEEKYKTPIFTAGQNHVAALRALGIKNFIGASYSALQNKIVIDYMTQAGFNVVSMEPIDVPFDQAGQISPEACYSHIKRLFREHKGADGIYIQGGAWRTEGIVEILEQDLQVPVVHANIAQAWEIQKRLRVNQPRAGLGRLLRELPEMVEMP
jgi:maleate cis-trans isomerase